MTLEGTTRGKESGGHVMHGIRCPILVRKGEEEKGALLEKGQNASQCKFRNLQPSC